MVARASIMALATPAASVSGHSTSAPEEQGVRGCRRHAQWPHVADVVIETENRVISFFRVPRW
jgi:hypothetical protein